MRITADWANWAMDSPIGPVHPRDMQMADVCPQPAKQRFWRVGQIARRTSLHRHTIAAYIADGTISTDGAFRTAGGKWRIANAAVEQFLRSLKLAA